MSFALRARAGGLGSAACAALAVAALAAPLPGTAQAPRSERVTPLAQLTPLPRELDHEVVATPDPARQRPGRVVLLHIDTRDTGVDLGFPPPVDARQASLPRVSSNARREAAAANEAAATGDAAAAGDAPAAGQRAGRGAEDAGTTAGLPRPSQGAAAASDGEDANARAALDAPLSAEGMSLDALTAAAAAEASRNRNGTMVRGRIGGADPQP